MKFLQINLSDYSYTGGTGIAMNRLHNGIQKKGFDSKVLCIHKELEDSHTIKLQRSNVVRALESLLLKCEVELGLNDISRVITAMNLKNHPAYQEADVITLHCIHDKFISYLLLPWITQKPTVFYLHDMWSFTGHCHYSYECDRWKTGCGQCPHPEVPGYIKRDNTRLEWQIKNWVYSHSNMQVVTPSKWMYNLVKESILNRFPIHHIPYGIDTEVYAPVAPESCRSQLGIPLNKKVLMFNALSLKDYRKGGDLLVRALSKLPESLKSEIVLLTIGKGDGLPENIGIQTMNMGFISSEKSKATLYSAADIFVCSTRADNSPLVLYESIACGTPVVGFNVGGVPDLVRPSVTGLLAETENVEALSNCILELLENTSLRRNMSQQCREVAVEEYSLDLYAQRFIDLYSHILQPNTSDIKEKTSVKTIRETNRSLNNV